MIQDVVMKDLDLTSDDRGYSFNVVNESGFGELEVQSIYPGIVRGWYKQNGKSIRYLVPRGMIKLVIYDDRDDSKSKGKFQEIFIGDRNPVLVDIPQKLWVGYKCISLEEAMVMVIKSSSSKEDKMEKLDPDVSYIKFNWGCKNR